MERIPSLPIIHDAFRVIDTHEKAYLLGFLLADGCVRDPKSTKRRRHRVNLKILAGDIQACLMLQAVAGGHVRFIEKGYRVEWDATSDGIARDLIALGITPRKTLTVSLDWDAVPFHLQGSVLAGLIDGDGHLRREKKYRRAEISVLTASPMLKDQLLERFPFFRVATYLADGNKRKNTLYQLAVESNRARLGELIGRVYRDLPFPILARKAAALEAIQQLLTEQEEYDRRIASIPEMKAAGMSIGEIAEAIGTSRSPVNRHLKDKGIDSRVVVFSEEDRETMRRLHGEGMSVLQIHATLGKGTEQAVRFHLQRLGLLTKKSKPLVRHAKADEILRLHREGMPAYKIAKELGIPEGTTAKILTQEGVTLVGGAPQKLFPDQVAWAARELTTGRTLKSVADALGVSGTLVRLRVRQMRRDQNPEPEGGSLSSGE
jgi:DNA-binding CsgD family transcriptional regulator